MIELKIEVEGAAAAAMVQRVRKGLASRAPLHARMADAGENFTKDYVSKLDGHATAQRLGANPTQHLAKQARNISSVSDEAGGAIRVPRASRLRAAFGSYTIKPGGGRKFLTIPANARTYGKRAGEIRETLHFQIVGGRFPALCFKDGTAAYWLKREVRIKENRKLLPFDQLPRLFARVARSFVTELQTEGGAA